MNCPELYLVALDGSGKPVAGAKLQTNVAGSTSLPKSLYADAALTAAHPNPLVADGGGVFPQFFMESGGYRFALLAPDGSQLRPPRDNIFGAGSGGGGVELDWKVKASSDDSTPGYLDAKVASTDSVVLSVDPASKKLKAELSTATQASVGKVSVADGDPAGYLAGKLKQGAGITLTPVAGASQQIEIAADLQGIPDKRVAVVSSDSPGYLWEKIEEGPGMDIAVVSTGMGDRALRVSSSGKARASNDGPLGYLEDVVGDSATVRPYVDDGILKMEVVADAVLDGKALATSTDSVRGYLVDKIRAGSGISITKTEDVGGVALWINSKTNNWRPVKYIAENYDVVDTDDTIIVIGGIENIITLPPPSKAYEGRKVTIQINGVGFSAIVRCIPHLAMIGDDGDIYDYGRIDVLCAKCYDNSFIWIRKKMA